MSADYKLSSERKDMEGTFCRAYSCRAAIEKFLADLFLFDAATGLYVASYNPKLTLETDDVQQIVWISGVNAPCNAFEIVRIFRFGDIDKYVKKEETATKRRPSYKAMLQLCAEDTAVKLTVIKDKNKSVNVNSDEWEAALSLNDRNQIEKTGQNIKLILLNDPQLKKVRFDRFTKQDITDCPDFCNERDNRIDDESIGKIAIYIENVYGLQLSQPRFLIAQIKRKYNL